MNTITYPGATEPITPAAIDGYQAARESGTVLHPVVGRESPDVTLAPASLRAGTLVLVFPDRDSAAVAFDAFAQPVAFTLTTATPSFDMYFVVTDLVRATLGSTRVEVVLEVPFQEVAP